MRIPNKTSVLSDRSCASSMIIQEYYSRFGSLRLSLSKTPSVIYLIRVAFEVQSSNLIEYPTSFPSSHPNSSATLFATLTAATLLGCVQPIIPLPAEAYCAS